MSPIELSIALSMAIGLSAVIGLEREIHGQPAGLRTHIILCIGACLASALSISFSRDYSNPQFGSDPARIVAQVISGVGFLGAGAIMKFGVNVKGLTTATSLWTTAIIGIACGAEYYWAAAISCIFVLITLTLMNKIGHKFLVGYKNREFKVNLRDRPGILYDLRVKLEDKNIKIVSLGAAMPDKTNIKISMVIRIPTDFKMDSLINLVREIEGAESMEALEIE